MNFRKTTLGKQLAGTAKQRGPRTDDQLLGIIFRDFIIKAYLNAL